jgi:hypothetical protein
MSDRRRFASCVLLTLSLVLLPGLALAGSRRAPAPAERESPFAFLIDWVARGWESLTHRNSSSPATPAPLDHAVGRAGCGIDPNGGNCG